MIGEDSRSKAQRKDMTKDFLIGEAIVHSTASFYDFIDGENADKKAYVLMVHRVYVQEHRLGGMKSGMLLV